MLKYYIGLALQMVALTLLPSIIVFQLFFGFRLIVMPICLTIGIIVFAIGTKIRDSR